MAAIEPKSGKLYKFGQGVFGPKWTEKWVHLDHHVLKYFSMASEQSPLFSLSSARQSNSIELVGYDFVLQEDKRITRKHVFHLLPKNKTSKAYVFACTNDKELLEWQDAFQARSTTAVNTDVSPIVILVAPTASMRLSCGFSCNRYPFHHTLMLLEVKWSKSGTLTSDDYVDWQGDMTEYSLLQQQLDPNVEGKIAREQFLRILKHYFTTRTKSPCPSETVREKQDNVTQRSSFSDHPSRTKHSEVSEPEVVSEKNPCDESLQPNDIPVVPPTVDRDDMKIQPSPEASPFRDWQSEFRQLEANDSDGDIVTRGLEMAAFLAEFQQAAENAIQDIVTEIVNDENRTIPSMALDDDQFLATDYSDAYASLRLQVSKFVVNGLLVYVTHDETTHKVFGHHFRAARAIHNAILETNANVLEVLLQCVVDYLGFRGLVLAMPSPQTARVMSSRMLLSCDRPNQQLILKQVEAVWKQLGVFVDDVGAPRDASHDRLPLFVGAASGVSTTQPAGGLVCTLHNLLGIFPTGFGQLAGRPFESMGRPELVSVLGGNLPLHPQPGGPSFSEEQRAILEQAIFTADEHLRLVVIPALVDAVENHPSHMYDSLTLTDALHRDGVNARCLGLCYEASASTHTRNLFVAEMIGRACKTELRSSLHALFCDASDVKQAYAKSLSAEVEQASEESREIANEHGMRVVHEFFNLVFGRGSSDSKAFWQDSILPRIQQQFPFSDASTWSTVYDSLASSEELTHWPQILQAVLYHTNIRISDLRAISFASSRPFPVPEALFMIPQSRTLCETTYECQRMLAQSDELIATGQIESALENVKTKISIVDIAPHGESSVELGRLLVLAAELSLVLGQVDESERLVSLALEANEQQSLEFARALQVKIKVMQARSLPLEEIEPLFEEAVSCVNGHFGGVHPLVFALYAAMIDVTRVYGDRNRLFHLFRDLAVPVKECHGKISLAYADLRRQEGDALVEDNRLEAAASVFDEAFSVYERLAQVHKDDATILGEVKNQGATCLHMIAHVQAAQGYTEAAFSTAVRALNMCREVLPEGHDDIVASLMQLGELCKALGDHFHALEYYRPALVHLKAHATVDNVLQLRDVSQAILHAHMQSLPSKLGIIDKTKSRFASTIETFDVALMTASDTSSSSAESSCTSQELELLQTVTHQLLALDPVDYFDRLVDNADDEWRSLRRERLTSATVRNDGISAEEPTCHSSLPPTASSSRFASFAIGQSPPPPSTTASFEPSASLVTSTGDFTHGAQLAALLFLASLPHE